MFRTNGECQRQILTRTPFVLHVRLNSAKHRRNSRLRTKGLNQGREVNAWGGRIKASLVESPQSLRFQLSTEIERGVVNPVFPIQTYSEAQLVTALGSCQVFGDSQAVNVKGIPTQRVEASQTSERSWYGKIQKGRKRGLRLSG